MLLFNKKDMQIICKYDGETVTFSKPLKDILKYQYKYNYRFKLYTADGYIIADDFKIEGDVLTVLFGTVTVTYSASGAEYNDTTGSGGGSGGVCECVVIATHTESGWATDKTLADFINNKITTVIEQQGNDYFYYTVAYITFSDNAYYLRLYDYFNRDEITIELFSLNDIVRYDYIG